jgi:transposase-like protein
MKTTVDGHRCFSREFKIAAVRRVLAGEDLNKVARELDLRYSLLWKWKKRVVEKGEDHLYTVGRGKRPGRARKNPSEGRSIAELERVIGRQQMEIRFLERALRQVEELRQEKNDDGAEASSKQ